MSPRHYIKIRKFYYTLDEGRESLPSARYAGMVVILFGGYMLEFFGFRTMKK
jgi:hypothetical protein